MTADAGEGPAVEVGPAFAEPLASLQNACFPEDHWDAALIGRLLALPGTFGLLAGGEPPTGFALVRVAADEAEILSIGIVPDVRRRGLGARLLGALAAAAAARGATALFLEVAEDNAAARALYLSNGFAEVGRRPGYYRRAGGPAVAALVLRRGLSPP